MERTKVVSELLAKYDTHFKLSEVETLLRGESLPPNASPTLLDIEQSIDPQKEVLTQIYQSRSSGNDNTE